MIFEVASLKSLLWRKHSKVMKAVKKVFCFHSAKWQSDKKVAQMQALRTHEKDRESWSLFSTQHRR